MKKFMKVSMMFLLLTIATLGVTGAYMVGWWESTHFTLAHYDMLSTHLLIGTGIMIILDEIKDKL